MYRREIEDRKIGSERIK